MSSKRRKKKGKKKKKLKKVGSNLQLFDGFKVTDTEYIKAKISESKFEKINVIVKKKSSGKFYAMKVMNKRKIVDGNDVENIRTERDLLKMFKHPFIVNLHYAFKSNWNLFFVMDFVPGGELFTHLKKTRRFSEDRARMYAAEIFCAISYLHKNHIVFRDLKPENILLAADGHLKLCDFGLSKVLNARHSKTNTWCGTPEYLAPEILLDCEEEGYGIAIDWWAFGVLIYEMIVGITPFYQEEVNGMYENIIYDDVVFPRKTELKRSTKNIIRKLLRRDPKDRLGTKSSLDIKNHPFFFKISWLKIEAKDVVPEFVPELSGPGDTRYVDKEFLNLPVRVEEDGSLGGGGDEGYFIEGGRSSARTHGEVFADFSYSGSLSLTEHQHMKRKMSENEKVRGVRIDGYRYQEGD